jgi:hypothetical protein
MRGNHHHAFRVRVITHESELHSPFSVFYVGDEVAVEFFDARDGLIGDELGRHDGITLAAFISERFEK